MINFSMLTFDLIINILIIAISLAAIIFACGVVWRTEKELDISYKLFLGAIIFFAVSQILGFFYFEGRTVIATLVSVGKLLFAIFFLAGMLTARDLIRKMDGEKGPVEDETDKV
jgi:hypothetical protein